MLFLHTCVGCNGVCLGCTTFGGDQTATLDVVSLLGVLLASCSNNSLCFLVSGRLPCTMLFTRRVLIRNFLFVSLEPWVLESKWKSCPESNQSDLHYLRLELSLYFLPPSTPSIDVCISITMHCCFNEYLILSTT